MVNDPIRRETRHGLVIGYKKCPAWLKKAYYKAINGICQDCNKHFDKLEPHRIIRGNQGGLYTVCSLFSILNNVRMLCNECHKKHHSKEPGCRTK